MHTIGRATSDLTQSLSLLPSNLTLKEIQKFSTNFVKVLNSRHFAINDTTRYLDELEEICVKSGDQTSLEKLKNMIVLEDEHIKIGGFVHKLGSIKLSVNKSKDIYNKFGHTILSYRAAMEYIIEDEDYTMYSESELLSLFNQIPEVKGYDRAQILVKVLQIPLIGWRSPGYFDILNGSIHRDNVQILTSSQHNGDNVMCTLNPNTPGQKIHFGYHNFSRNLGILVVRKKF